MDGPMRVNGGNILKSWEKSVALVAGSPAEVFIPSGMLPNAPALLPANPAPHLCTCLPLLDIGYENGIRSAGSQGLGTSPSRVMGSRLASI